MLMTSCINYPTHVTQGGEKRKRETQQYRKDKIAFLTPDQGFNCCSICTLRTLFCIDTDIQHLKVLPKKTSRTSQLL